MFLVWTAKGFAAAGGGAYAVLLRAATAALAAMMGGDAAGVQGRRDTALAFYPTGGAVALLVGMTNPVGSTVTPMSALAATVGGLAGFISIARMRVPPAPPQPFVVARAWPVVVAGAVAAAVFAAVLGPSLRLA